MNRAGREGARGPAALPPALELRLNAFALAVRIAFAIPELGVAPGALGPPGAPELRVELAEPGALSQCWSGPAAPPSAVQAHVDRSTWTAERGRAGDVRMEHRLARLHLDAAATCLLCAPTRREDPAWRRLLLDTALVTVSLVSGNEGLHAAGVVTERGAVAIAGAAGAGKTSLVIELLRRGARFLADDVVVLTIDGGRVLAHPAPPVLNVPLGVDAPSGVRPQHRLGEEIWASVDDPSPEAVPLRAVTILQRTPAPGGPEISRLEPPGPALLAHALRGGPTPERQAQRLAVLGALAESADILALRVPDGAPPAAAAQALLGALA